MDNFSKGTIIKAPNWPEPVEINLIEDAGDYVHIVGSTKNSRIYIDQLISKEEFEQFKLDQFKANFSEEAWKVFLALETTRYPHSFYDC